MNAGNKLSAVPFEECPRQNSGHIKACENMLISLMSYPKLKVERCIFHNDILPTIFYTDAGLRLLFQEHVIAISFGANVMEFEYL